MQAKPNDTNFNPNLPLVRSISSNHLKSIGYIKFGVYVKPGSQVIVTTYKNGDNVITYDGVTWLFNGKQVQFIEDLNQKDDSIS